MNWAAIWAFIGAHKLTLRGIYVAIVNFLPAPLLYSEGQ